MYPFVIKDRFSYRGTIERMTPPGGKLNKDFDIRILHLQQGFLRARSTSSTFFCYKWRLVLASYFQPDIIGSISVALPWFHCSIEDLLIFYCNHSQRTRGVKWSLFLLIRSVNKKSCMQKTSFKEDMSLYVAWFHLLHYPKRKLVVSFSRKSLLKWVISELTQSMFLFWYC